MKTVAHPTLPWTLTFDPATHRYTDQESRLYLSGTAFVHRLFPAFDATTSAARVAARTGQDPAELAAAWTAKGAASASYGTAVHAYAEAIVTGQKPPQPASDAQGHAFTLVDRALALLAPSYEFLGAESIVFDPLYQIAGTIDLPARNRATGAVAILDWKTCERITDDAYGQTALPPRQHLPNSKLCHYSMQLSTYAALLRSGYIGAHEPVELALIHIAPGASEPDWIPLPHLEAETDGALQERAAELIEEAEKGW